MSFSILKKSTRRTIGIIAAIIITGIIIFGFLSTYRETKNKAVPKVNLVETAIYTDKIAPLPVLYEAVATEQCIQQLSVDISVASSSAAVISSEPVSPSTVLSSMVSSSTVSLSSAESSIASASENNISSSSIGAIKKSVKKIQQTPEPVLVNASSPRCLAQTPAPAGYEQLGAEGAVTLSLNLAETGRVERGEIEKSSGFAELDAAALKQVTETWQFQPCKKAGAVVACKQYIRFRWQAK